MNKQQVDDFEKIHAQLEGLHEEISALSKKSQNDPLNKFKLKFVNQLLIATNTLLGKYKPFADFSVFEEAEMPTNSDAAVMLMQYLNCMEKMRSDNIRLTDGYPFKWYWVIDTKLSGVETTAPKKIKDK